MAGLMPVRDYDDACGAFDRLAALSDVTIVLDDGSASPFPFAARCDEVVTLNRLGPWNDVGNRTLLMQRAFVHGCDWVVMMDDDLIFSHGFQTREDVARVVDDLRRRRIEIGLFPLRDLWGATDRVRVDGVWGRKAYAVLRRNWFQYPAITLRDPGRRLHAPLFPANLRPRRAVLGEHVAYHTGCFTPSAREERVARYRLDDPDNRFQRDYGYMIDETGLVVEPVPAPDVWVIEQVLGRVQPLS